MVSLSFGYIYQNTIFLKQNSEGTFEINNLKLQSEGLRLDFAEKKQRLRFRKLHKPCHNKAVFCGQLRFLFSLFCSHSSPTT